jgi:large subunit ribosomal protein L31
MKEGIHPKYELLTATCSCGNVLSLKSTRTGTMNLDVCSACHPFYTGKQKMADTGGRIDRFKKRFGARTQA